MKKEIFEWSILIWTSLLVLLISGWVMIEFYDWKDTIVAAIIAFVGAIIGGSITLIGVKMTINNAKKQEESANLHFRKKALDITINKLSEANDKIYRFRRQKQEFEGALGGLINSLDNTNGIIDNAVISSKNAYQSIIKLDYFVRKLRWEKEYQNLHNDYKYYLLDIEIIKCFQELDKERQQILSKILEKHSN